MRASLIAWDGAWGAEVRFRVLQRCFRIRKSMLAVFQHSELDAECVSALGNRYMLCFKTRKLMLSACQQSEIDFLKATQKINKSVFFGQSFIISFKRAISQ